METKHTEVKLSKKENITQVLKFIGFSISAGIIEVIAFSIFNELTSWSYWPCYLIALTLSVVWNFTLNREFTFKSANNVPLAMIKIFCFYLVFTPLSTWWGSALTNIGWNEYIVLLGTMAVNLSSEFLYDRFYVFRGTMYTNKRATTTSANEEDNNTADGEGCEDDYIQSKDGREERV